MVEVTAGSEMIPHQAFWIVPSMLNGSFSQGSFGFANVVFPASWAADFVHYIGFAQQRCLVLKQSKVPEFRCLEEGFDIDLLLCVQECNYLLPKGFDKVFSGGTDVRHVEPQGYYVRILFFFSLLVRW